MKKTLSLILALVMIAATFAFITVPASAKDMGKTEGSVYDGTMDKTWYNAEDPKTEYTLYTAAELAGLADLVNTDGVKFEGVTIKLGADIIWNEGTFTLGKDNKTPVYNGALVDETVNVWPVIGERPSGNNDQAPTVKEKIDDVEVTRDRKYFYGNFDGQGHVISGLYANNTGAYTSLFSVFYGESIKNLTIVNSFFGSESRTGAFAGFVANANTKKVTLENLYTDAIMVLTKADSNARSGGIIGMARRVNSITIKNAWFDGTISALSTNGYTPYIGGIAGFIVADAADSLGEVVEFDSCLVTGTINADLTLTTMDLTKRGIGGIMGSFHTGSNAALTAPVNVNVKNCLVAVKATNLARTEETDMRSMGAFIPRFETCWATYTVENSYFVPNGIFSTSNTMSHINGSETAGTTFNGTLIATKHTVPTEETIPTANIAKIADAQGLEAFDLTGKTAALKGIRTGLVKNFSIWDGTVDTSWFDINDIKTEYTLTTAAQFAGLAEIVDNYPTTKDGDKTVYGKPFNGVTIKLGTNMVLNAGTFTLGADKKTAVYNGALISATNPVNVWNPIGVSYNGGNNCNPTTTNAFWGNFDGQGYVISGMYVNNPATQQQGLFGIFAGSELKNVVITNSYVLGNSRNGSVVGFVANAKTSDVAIKNIYSDAFVVSTSADANLRSGGIFGMFMQCLNVTIEDVEFAGVNSGFVGAETKAAGQLLGGIIGVIKGEIADKTYTIKNCKMTGSIYNNYNGKDNGGQVRCGGIMGGGYKFYGSIINCSANLADTNITAANGFKADKVGGMVGYHENVGAYTYENCEFTHIGLFTKGMDATTTFNNDTCTVNGMNKAEWLADTTGKDVATGTHAYTDVAAKEATCTEAGNVAYKVCDCGSKVDAEGKEIADVTVAAKGHTYGEWVAPVDPTETAAGVLGHFECSVCHKYFDADKNEMTSIEGAPALGTTPGTDPGTTPGTDPGTTPGTDPEQPGTNPEQPGTNPVVPETDPEQPGTTPEQPGTTPTTNAPTTDAPVEEKGCGKKNGGFAAVVALVAIMGAAIVIKKK